MENLKDKITNIAGVLIAIGGVIVILEQSGVILPQWIITTGIVLASLGGAIVSYFTGKNPNGTVKADSIIEIANKTVN